MLENPLPSPSGRVTLPTKEGQECEVKVRQGPSLLQAPGKDLF